MAVKQLAKFFISVASVVLVAGSTGTGSKFTAQEKTDILNAHNQYRGNATPEASDMVLLTWNNTLAEKAQSCASHCNLAHCSIGENIYASIGYHPSPSGAVTSWANEKDDYDYFANHCAAGQTCGHYTQVVWAETREVGCGIEHCSTLVYGTQTFSDSWTVVCNYSPSGNMNNAAPYTSGTACSSCSGDTKFCQNDMCADCTLGQDGCTCELECQNGGTLDSTACSCTCTADFGGPTCASTDDSRCGANPGWPASWCNTYTFVQQGCPIMCG